MTELWTTSSPSVKRQPAGLGKIESYKWKDMRPAGLVQIQAVDTTVLPPPRLRRLTASSSPINIALNWGWMKASLTRIGQLGQQSCKLSLPYTSKPNYSFALFVVFRPHARDQKITMHRKYSIMKYSDSDSVLSLLHHYVYYLSCKNSPFVYKVFPWCSTYYWSGLRSGPAVQSSTTSSNCDYCISHQDHNS